MELEGLKRCLAFLEGIFHLTIKDIVTDRHVMIKKYIKEDHATKNHYFYVWHVAKGMIKLYGVEAYGGGGGIKAQFK
jgi:hypothetical protein